MRYEILIKEKASAASNMERDCTLLESMAEDPRCILHLYGWEAPSATYGYFIDPSRYFDLEAVTKQGMQLARRPTGGGIIFHTCDVTFSLLIPASHARLSLNPLDNYRWINQAVLQALSLPALSLEQKGSGGAFCMAKPTRYDLMWEGRKIGGAAERRTKQGMLHQGSIALALPDPTFLCEVLRDGAAVAEEMEQQSKGLLGSHASPAQIAEAQSEIRLSLIKFLKKNM